jgi:hypothetical protein
MDQAKRIEYLFHEMACGVWKQIFVFGDLTGASLLGHCYTIRLEMAGFRDSKHVQAGDCEHYCSN